MSKKNYTTTRNYYKQDDYFANKQFNYREFAIEHLKKQTYEIEGLIEYYNDKFTNWEKSFLDSLLKSNYGWTAKQKEVLLKIKIRIGKLKKL